MSILSKIVNAPKWAVALASSVASAAVPVVGWFWLEYNQFRSKQIEASKVVAEQSIAADAELDPFIIKYKNLIIGKYPVSDKDKDDFEEAIRRSYAKAEQLKNRYLSLTESFDTYTKALVGLKQAIDNLQGPSDGKKYFVALSKYIVAQASWKQNVSSVQSSYVRSFAFR